MCGHQKQVWVAFSHPGNECAYELPWPGQWWFFLLWIWAEMWQEIEKSDVIADKRTGDTEATAREMAVFQVFHILKWI